MRFQFRRAFDGVTTNFELIGVYPAPVDWVASLKIDDVPYEIFGVSPFQATQLALRFFETLAAAKGFECTDNFVIGTP